ncbi:MAG: CopG family transcriptional regulator [Sulfuricurvum sp. PC08-66]|nr:MAG: CopG family transcriptional regulator [Sulfuricurvum sp. PC08-66]
MNFTLRIPDYYRQEIEALKGDVSINQFIVSALSEKIASLRTEEYLLERARRGSRTHALDMLKNAPDVEAREDDRV